MAGAWDGSRTEREWDCSHEPVATPSPASWSTCARPTIRASTARHWPLLERPLLAHVLALTGGNQLRAARLLGLNRNNPTQALPRALAAGHARGPPAPVSASASPTA